MARYAGVQFETVSSEYLFALDGILIITEPTAGKKFVVALRQRNKPVSVETYSTHALKRVGSDKADKLTYELYVRRSGFTLSSTLDRIRASLNEMGLLWRATDVVRQTGEKVNLEDIDYYVYVIRHKTINCLYVDYDFFNKKLKNPMGPKSATFNGHVTRGVAHSNRVMHAFTARNFPLVPDDWTYCKVIEKVTGITNAKRSVGELSTELMRQGVVILNCVYGIDPVSYRNNRLPLPKVNIEGYLNSKPIPRVITKIGEMIP